MESTIPVGQFRKLIKKLYNVSAALRVRLFLSFVLANSTKMCYTYDSLSRVTARTIKKLSDNSVVSTETFNYDAAGNVTSAPDSSFQYDTNSRLISFNDNLAKT